MKLIELAGPWCSELKAGCVLSELAVEDTVAIIFVYRLTG